MRLLIALLLALMAAPVSAQVAPGIFTTLKTTDTTANSLLVGCAVGSTTCTGGIKAGPIVGTTGTFSGAVSTAALTATQVTVNGVGIIASDGRIPAISSTYFASLSGANLTGVALLASVNTFTAAGAHTWSGAGNNSLNVRNTSAGAAQEALINLGNDTSASTAILKTFSSTFTTSNYEIADGALLRATAAGGLQLAATHASGVIGLWTGSTRRFAVDTSGNWLNGSNIMDSTGTPTIASGFGTSPSISGTDYAFTVTNGNPSNNGTVNFGRTWTNAPVCVATTATSGGGVGQSVAVGTVTTTSLIISYSAGGDNGGKTTVHCRGF